MRFFALLVAICFITQHARSQSGWTPLESPVNTEFHSCAIIDDEHIIVAGEFTIIRSVDAGEHWTGLVDHEMGFLWTVSSKRNGNFTIVGGDDGLLMSSVDYGETWTPIPTGLQEGSFIFGSQVIDENTFYLSGSRAPDTSIVMKTTDGGKHWTSKEIRGMYLLMDIQFLNDQIGFTCGITTDGTGKILKTTDGGEYWASIYEDSVGYVSSIQCISDSLIYGTVSGLDEEGVFIRTANGGADWFKLQVEGHSIFGNFFNSPDHGFTFGDGLLWETSDSGYHWDDVGDGLLQTIYCIDGSDNMLLAVGTGGILLKYTLPASVDLFAVPPAFTYPIPATSRLTVMLPEGNKHVVVYDVLGRVVYANDTEQPEIVIERGNLERGSYYYVISAEGKPLRKGSFIFE